MAQDFDSIPATTLLSDVRQKILNRDDAHATWFLGAAEPTTMYAGMPWVDTGNTLIKLRNEANTAWYTLGSFAAELAMLQLTGGNMAGDILLQGNPTNILHPSTKQYTDGKMRVNKGKAWISHGNNVITFGTAHADNNYLVFVGLVNTPMGGVETRGSKHTKPMEVYSINDSTTRAVIRIDGGYGFTSGGDDGAVSGITQRFDDIANTQTGRAVATARNTLAGYSLNGFGFTSGGWIAAITGVTQRFDDAANTHTARLAATARQLLACYSLNGLGFTSCGYIAAVTGLTQRFDDAANTHTARLAATARFAPAGYSLNGKGFTSCGNTGVISGITQSFDDDANTHTGRLAATARAALAGYSLKGKGFTSCGDDGAVTDEVERFDDDANTHTARLAATARNSLVGYSLNGFGFTSCGYIAAITGLTERFDDDANTHTGRANATARLAVGGYATNEYFINYITFNI
ncbi:hypothetical protein LCGC14_0825520 [marine sediment metagenome]|uniref:Uncharacterized protein n=1 Tax=marine sediment metagenome TaxID=412755 RepID=A0A0F9Q2U9_9ZZZZ